MEHHTKFSKKHIFKKRMLFDTDSKNIAFISINIFSVQLQQLSYKS